MSYLLDTNVIGEPTKKQPHPKVVTWLGAQANEELFLSAVTIGEILRGILLLATGRKRRNLLRWLETGVKSVFSGRILPADLAVMEQWAELQVGLARKGKGISVMDGLLAAVALTHGLTLATRNTAHFAETGVPLCNPWEHDPM